ncbi:unnamed protein product [Chondrus crispus]|uniref:PNPLA domain-containing protein n=1 Tax=Chondrus crispus TaxID=2769 RepID=R7Q7G2_CHOCR|nr:unnamed protein product [Chondrus crispus]CDF34462.1 unnamed protein product [Chondrus crispus]|eukprot:XP_005714281.1 unnamed protein product [Chondrus crispus]
MSWSRPVPDYSSDIRLGIVMYGGVSLAVYINGVAGELFNLTCSTPAESVQLETDSEPQTRPIYRILDSQTQKLLSSRPPVRFVVDVISGTSAGGLNGLCLAKAIANGEDFGALSELWIKEADLSILLNDNKSFEGLRGQSRKGETPTSLLNSDRLYEKLFDVLKSMKKLDFVGGTDASISPLSDGVDLSVTTTDIEGVPVPLRLFDRVVNERRHRVRFRFRAMPGDSEQNNAFAAQNLPLMAFVGRSTSSFPVAFEPMRLDDLSRLENIPSESLKQWNAYFDSFPAKLVEDGEHIERSFGDGGYLDNKPFSYVVQALSEIETARAGRRQLIYIEPSPKQIDQKASDYERPDAIENSVAALLQIPRYETIREDLNTVIARNRMIERIEHLVRLGEGDIKRNPAAFDNIESPDGTIPNWNAIGLSQMIAYYGISFLPYRRLRVYAVTDELARRLGSALGLDVDSDHFQSIRAVVRAWRDRHYGEEVGDRPKTQNAFLGEFDIDYRYRRLGFLSRRVAELIPTGIELASVDELQKTLQILRIIYREMTRARRHLIQGSRQSVDLGDASASALRAEAKFLADYLLLGAIDPTKPSGSLGTMPERMAGPASRWIEQGEPGGCETLHGRLDSYLDSLRYRSLVSTEDRSLVFSLLGRPKLSRTVDADNKPVTFINVRDAELLNGEPHEAQQLNSAIGLKLRRFLSDYHVRFDSYDQMGFPLQHRTIAGDTAAVDLVRISPSDATALVNEAGKSASGKKLAGTALGNFGAFLDRRWRTNDLMWGRLDGAERLIHSTLSGDDASSQALRKILTSAAHEAILDESFGQDAIKDPLSALRSVLDELKINDDASRQRLTAVLSSFLSPSSLVDYLQHNYAKPQTPDRESTFSNLARGVSIFGRVLGGISERQEKRSGVASASAWIARLGLILQGFVAISLPGSLRQKWARSVFQSIYIIGGFVFLSALVLGKPDVVSVAITALILTGATQVITLLASDAMRDKLSLAKSTSLKVLVAILGGAILLALFTGVSAIIHDGVFGIFCDYITCEIS